MAHSDDDGLVLPPRLAPTQVVMVPIFKNDEQLDAITEKAEELKASFKQAGVRFEFDDRTTFKPGWKFAQYELQGVPLRIAMGPRDLENGTVELARRDTKEKQSVNFADLGTVIPELLEEIQANIFNKAKAFRDERITKVESYEELQEVLNTKGGFVSAHWDGTTETENKIQEETKATIRCIPFDFVEEEGVCVYSGKPSTRRVLFAKAY